MKEKDAVKRTEDVGLATIQIKIPRKVHRELKVISVLNGIKLQDTCVEAINEYVAKHGKKESKS